MPEEAATRRSGAVLVSAPDGVGEVAAGDDLAEILIAHATLLDGDIVIVTSKVVSKAEGRLRQGDAGASLDEETRRVVARSGSIKIVRGRLGITHAMAGLDNSNVASGSHLLLPEDPDASARGLRQGVWEATGINVACLVSDSAGRAWRLGQTEIAIGAAGLAVLESYVGDEDGYGNVLKVTQPCVADELCSAAELVSGKTTRRPFAIIRGRGDLVCPAGVVGEGAATLIRPQEQDLFGFGAREAVLRALAGRPIDASAFGAAASPDDLARALSEALSALTAGADAMPSITAYDDEVVIEGGRIDQATHAVAFAHGWVVASDEGRRIRLVRISP